MSQTGPTGVIDPRYGDPSATPPPWADIERRLQDAGLYWIVTVRADGRPHAVPLVGVWHEGAFAFCTTAQEQKVRNLDGNPSVAVTTGTTGAGRWDSGVELVMEGEVARVTDPDRLQRLADAWFAKYGDDWRFEVRGQGFVEASEAAATDETAPVYRLAPGKVLAFGGGHGQTAYRF
ncbi:pyridoxamine 5'-phosphate oxidase family protein [Cellulomonas fengjieae]|uniref:Pyridoxamine 5'-phosphate oxidase family protein n=1 Tax=Cellulomonas fengjieae TaxID=2819978 RepID=A0ABS3SET4_9CELL|nr:pyridoxamine 5'-phosphate oxidase family protein [Cellulomonas fengjieae]MBO3084266.1 pyridoxamine 5'-phosphate oxidase family protein [Cellulomonas fengjieae]MBO3103514.1 pyridoxamine 5'-phosphate oxidase family protein [Cellulomonas fengjieae]QVI64497.1 pyridoxamine 5'-phosphate oxidase family protein [Cellulomonas fengjieae]